MKNSSTPSGSLGFVVLRTAVSRWGGRKPESASSAARAFCFLRTGSISALICGRESGPLR